MRPRLKICCIASVEEARIAIAAGADAVGLVAEMPSGPGPIADALIAEIAASVPPPVSRFLLTSRTDTAGIIAHVQAARVDTVQLVDAVAMAVYGVLRQALPALRIVQVLHVESEQSLADAQRVAPEVDAILLDSGRPNAVVRELGGTGRTHDWRLSRRIARTCGRPVFLAGGLNENNIADAISQVRPYGLDLCSSVRTDGRLDADKLARLVAAIA